MKKIELEHQTEHQTHFISDDLSKTLTAEPIDLRKNLRSILTKDERKYLALYARLLGINRIGVLHAHGCMLDNGQGFKDGDRAYNLQRWIDTHQRGYHALAFFVCMSPVPLPEATTTALIVPSSEIYFDSFERYSPESEDFFKRFDLWVPKKGILNGYVIESEIKDLQRRIYEKEHPKE